MTRRAAPARPAARRDDHIRPARRSDRSIVAALWTQADQLHADLHPCYFRGDGQLDARLDKALAPGTDAHEIFVVERASTVIGFVLVELLDPKKGNAGLGRRAHIDTLVVAASARRGGCGRRLIDAAAAWAKARRAEELLLTVWAGNDDAERFYERIGLQAVSRVMKLPL